MVTHLQACTATVTLSGVLEAVILQAHPSSIHKDPGQRVWTLHYSAAADARQTTR